MVVLVSFVLVLAAAVTLVVGLLQSGLTLIYVSIACSVVAGLVLAVAVLRGRPEPKPAAAGRPVSAPAAAPPPPAPARSVERAPAREPEPATVGGGWASASTATTEAPPAPPPPPPPPAPSRGDSAQAAGAALLGRLRRKGSQPADAAPEPEPVQPAAAETPSVEPAEPTDVTEEIGAVPTAAAGDGFPIEGYERLRATEIIGRLDELDRAQLEQVREREASTKNRFTVMNRIDARLEETADQSWDAGDEEWDDGAGEPADEFAEVDVVVESRGDAGFPIPDYESLRVSQILPLLGTLSPAERDQVRQREEQGRARSTILDRIRRLDGGDGGVGAIVLPPAAPAAPKRAGRKRAPLATTTATSKAAPKKAPVKRTAAAKEAVAKAAPTPRRSPAATKAGATTKAPARAGRPTAKAGATPVPGAKRTGAIKKATAKKAR